MADHFEANDALLPVKKPRCEPIHRCPICDRFRRTINDNAAQVWRQLSRISGKDLTARETRELLMMLIQPLHRIDRALHPGELRRIQTMTDHKAEHYMRTKFIDPDWSPFEPHYQPVDDAGESPRPTLTLIQGGQSPRPATRPPVHNLSQGGDL
jgi:hypothetical protein